MSKQAVKIAAEPDPLERPHEDSVDLALSEPGIQQEIAQLAYEFWESRGRPDGSPEEDWFRAEREVQSRDSNGS